MVSSGFYGADVDQLRQASQGLEQAAEALERSAAAIATHVSRTDWHGPDADRFRGDWDGPHRRAVAVAVASLRGAATTLRRNADSQQLASRADAPASVAPASRPRSVPAAPGLTGADYATAVRDAADTVLGATLPGTHVSVDGLAGLIPGLGDGVTIFDGLSKLTRGQVPWHEAVDFASGLVDKGTPLTYGIGVDMRLWADVIDTGQRFFSGDTAHGGMDWSARGMSDLWKGLSNPQVVAETARETLNQLAPMLVNIFKPAL